VHVQCRERRLTYRAPLRGTVVARVDNGLEVELRSMKIADIPIMVQVGRPPTHSSAQII
jgi:DNA-directed RNA polymerase beta subunit